MLIKKSKTKPMKLEKKVTIKEESSSSSDVKHDTLIKTMERMTIVDREAEPLIRNSNDWG